MIVVPWSVDNKRSSTKYFSTPICMNCAMSSLTDMLCWQGLPEYISRYAVVYQNIFLSWNIPKPWTSTRKRGKCFYPSFPPTQHTLGDDKILPFSNLNSTQFYKLHVDKIHRQAHYFLKYRSLAFKLAKRTLLYWEYAAVFHFVNSFETLKYTNLFRPICFEPQDLCNLVTWSNTCLPFKLFFAGLVLHIVTVLLPLPQVEDTSQVRLCTLTKLASHTSINRTCPPYSLTTSKLSISKFQFWMYTYIEKECISAALEFVFFEKRRPSWLPTALLDIRRGVPWARGSVLDTSLCCAWVLNFTWRRANPLANIRVVKNI